MRTPTLFAIVLSCVLLLTTGWTEDSAPPPAEQAAQILSEARLARYAAIDVAELKYRAAIARTFRFASRVEVYLLDFSIGTDADYKPSDDDDTFPIRPYETATKVLKQAIVPTDAIPSWCSAVTKTITSERPEGGAFCHFPIYGLRIFAGDELLFETSICWKCQNYYVDDNWQRLTADSKDLERLLGEFMPVPEKEKDRFDQWNPKLKKL